MNMLRRVVALLSAAVVSCICASASAQEPDQFYQCRLSPEDMASPAAMWAWAQRGKETAEAYYGNETEILLLMVRQFGIESLEPYKDTEGYRGLVARIDEFRVFPPRDSSGRAMSGKAQQRRATKRADASRRAFAKADFSAKMFPKNLDLPGYMSSVLGPCDGQNYVMDDARRARITVARDARDWGTDWGPFPIHLCERALERSYDIDDGSARAANVPIRRWRGDYLQRRGAMTDTCPFLPKALTDTDDIRTARAEIAKDLRLERYLDARRRSASYCFPGVRPNLGDAKTVKDAVYWRSSDPRYGHVTDEAVGELDTGDGEVTEISVSTAYNLYTFYRLGAWASVQTGPVYGPEECLKRNTIYCGIPFNGGAARTLEDSRARDTDKVRILEENFPEKMTPATGEFLRRNLGDCALADENIAAASVEGLTRVFEEQPRGTCLFLEDWITDGIKKAERTPGYRVHPDDIAWLERWQARDYNGEGKCINDYDPDLVRIAKSSREFERRMARAQAEMAAERDARRAADQAAIAEFQRALRQAPPPPPRTRQEITPFGSSERDIRNWENYQEAQRCSNPTSSGC